MQSSRKQEGIPPCKNIDRSDSGLFSSSELNSPFTGAPMAFSTTHKTI